MAAHVGGVTCDFVKGPINDPVRRLAEWHVSGLDGIGLMDLGKYPQHSRLRAIRFGSAGTCSSWLASLKALEGAGKTSVENDIGETDADTHVISVRRTSVRAATPLYAYRYEAEIDIIAGASGT